ncbi:MAG: GspE/PulE family protein [Halioglobus sp.]
MSLLSDATENFRIPVSYARKFGLLFDHENGSQVAFIADRTTTDTIVECQRIAGPNITIIKLSNDEFSQRTNFFYESTTSDAKEVVEQIESESDDPIESVVQMTQDLLTESEDSAPVVRLINAIMIDAIKQRASDIHIETYGSYFCVRYRIDGLLHDAAQPNKTLANALISRVKVMANMDIAEKRAPQDGAVSVVLAHREVDVRVSTLPTRHGERVVMRLLNKQTDEINLDTIGLSSIQYDQISALLTKPQGLVLVTGPTGSGKSTTLYAGLKQLDITGKNVLTVEDPIEYELPGIGQTQINSKAGVTFSGTLKAMLRQDPDIVMVGEVRDEETAKTAVQASLTGHLVLSTLHTNNAIGAIIRLIDMGVESYLLAATLHGIVGQRLVRVLCPKCRTLRKTTQQEKKLLGANCMLLYNPGSCAHCLYKGFIGRTGIYEVLTLNTDLRSLIQAGAPERELAEYLNSSGQTMAQNGYAKAVQGITTLDEVLRVATV